LSASIGALIECYAETAPDAELIGYLNGYQGLLKGRFIEFPANANSSANLLYTFGGSPLGNSRVKLTNAEDCVRKVLVSGGDLPLEVAAKQLQMDRVTILHTIGGDDTNTMAAELARYLSENNYDLTVVGLPKTVDNDIVPISQSLGADTAAEQGALFFENIANENTASPRNLIIHEVMGRHCGWLTAATAKKYRDHLANRTFNGDLNLYRENWDIDAIYIPELQVDLGMEGQRLAEKMDQKDNVNIFLSEGACQQEIISEMERNNEDVKKDAFGHVRLDDINSGKWFAKRFSKTVGAEKTLVQKSGYFARSAAPNEADLILIKKSAALAVQFALNNQSGVVGMDEDNDGEPTIIDFDRIKGGKPFNTKNDWFQNMLQEIGQID
jgi:pyrophosphate--fructose-6-phosphate 1-phosphotransferase